MQLIFIYKDVSYTSLKWSQLQVAENGPCLSQADLVSACGYPSAQ